MSEMLKILCGDVMEQLGTLGDESVQCCVTSPPYWGLRDYSTNGQIGLEKTPEEYVGKMVEVFREVRRVLRKDGTLFLNLGSSYASSDQRGNVPSCGNDGTAQSNFPQPDSGYSDLCDECLAARLNRNSSSAPHEAATGDASLSKVCKVAPSDSSLKPRGASPRASHPSTTRPSFRRDRAACVPAAKASDDQPKWTSSFDGGSITEHKMAYTSDTAQSGRPLTSGMMGTTFSCKACGNLAIKPLRFKPKDMVPIPWMVAMALQADGWWLRSDIIWAKPNPMPESVTDRPTKSHEYLFLLTKSANYFYDAEAIREPIKDTSGINMRAPKCGENRVNGTEDQNQKTYDRICGANKRSVWTVATAPYPEAHFATYPPDLIKPCILAGTSAKGCCAKCGSQWERVVDSPKIPTDLRNRDDDTKMSFHTRQLGGGQAIQNWRDENPSKTIGWEPACGCTTPLGGEFPVRPCTVLDPFAGSGTTGAVALELGRKAILIELNPKYVELIDQRCNTTLGLALA